MGFEPTTLCLQSICSSNWSYDPILNYSGAEETWTLDILLARQVLSQLSYSPILNYKVRPRGVEPRIAGYKPGATYRITSGAYIVYIDLYIRIRSFIIFSSIFNSKNINLFSCVVINRLAIYQRESNRVLAKTFLTNHTLVHTLDTHNMQF